MIDDFHLLNIDFIFSFSQENFVTQVTVAEDFRELLIEKNNDLAERFVRSKRTLLENAFTEFVRRNKNKTI